MNTIQYRPDIQGLRTIAVLAVMVFHFNAAWLAGGFVGVDVFLVISGFLIVSILLNKKSQPSYRLLSTLQFFYQSRFKRIAPAYFTMLIVASLLAAVLFLPQDLEVYRKSLNKAAWFNSNNYFAHFGDYFAPASHEQPLLHTWSLAVEIQFYLLVPLLVLLLPTKAIKWLFGTALIGFTALAEYRLQILGIEQATYYSLYARLPEFLAGGLVALNVPASGNEWDRPSWPSFLGLVLIALVAIVQPYLGHFPGVPALLPLVGAALVLLYPAKGITLQLLANRPMVWLGELSYSLYLWHWPVLALLRYYTGSQVLDMPFGLLFVSITLLLAALSFYGVENPLRNRRTSIKQLLGYYTLFTFIAVGVALGMVPLNQALSPESLPVEYQRYADPNSICHGQIVRDCLKGDLASEKEVLVLGDSHAAMLNLFFDRLGKELGFKARIITASSCVTIPGFDYKRIPEWARESCLKQIEEAEFYIKRSQIIFLAGMWSWQLQSDEFKAALLEFLKAGAPQAKKYVMSQVPLLNKNPIRDHRFHYLGLGGIMGRNESYLVGNSYLEKVSETCCKITYLKLADLYLFSQANNKYKLPLYYDDSHLNEVGVLEYSKEAKTILSAVLLQNMVFRSIE